MAILPTIIDILMLVFLYTIFLFCYDKKRLILKKDIMINSFWNKLLIYLLLILLSLSVFQKNFFKNIQFVGASKKSELISKYPQIMIHRVNTVSDLRNSRIQKFKKIEFDVMYDTEKKAIIMGHDLGSLTGKTLEEYLSFENEYFQTLWLDFKNITDETYVEILDELNRLDKQYNLKSRLLLESSMVSKNFSKFSDNGWKTSYYMPYSLFQMKDRSNPQEIKEYATSLSKQLKEQKVSSISFDYRLYSFIQDRILNNLDDGIRLNMWSFFVFDDTKFNQELPNWINDSQIDNFIVKYPRKYDR